MHVATCSQHPGDGHRGGVVFSSPVLCARATHGSHGECIPQTRAGCRGLAMASCRRRVCGRPDAPGGPWNLCPGKVLPSRLRLGVRSAGGQPTGLIPRRPVGGWTAVASCCEDSRAAVPRGWGSEPEWGQSNGKRAFSYGRPFSLLQSGLLGWVLFPSGRGPAWLNPMPPARDIPCSGPAPTLSRACRGRGRGKTGREKGHSLH